MKDLQFKFDKTKKDKRNSHYFIPFAVSFSKLNSDDIRYRRLTFYFLNRSFLIEISYLK